MYRQTSFKTWAVNDRPTNKIAQNKAAASDAELLSVILGNTPASLELSRQLLADAGGLSGLQRWSAEKLAKYNGIGKARAAALIAALQLGRRSEYAPPAEKISSSQDAYSIFRPHLANREKEHFFAVFMNKANKVISVDEIAIGGLTACIVDPRVLFLFAVEKGAAVIAVAHNHPSGAAFPSQADLDITRKIKEGAKLLDIALIDHIIVAGNTYYSFADSGNI